LLAKYGYSIKTASLIIPGHLSFIYRAIKRGLFYLLFDLTAPQNISKPIQQFSASKVLSCITFPSVLTCICLFIGGCLDSGKNNLPSLTNTETVQAGVRSVIEKANYELARPHSKLITINRDQSFGSLEYVSLATYWWPNPETENGLPYVRRDGRVNPESMSDLSNLPQLIRMARRIEILSAAYRFTGNEIYADRAVEQLRVWFINPETAMLPHLEHAQMIRGLDSGRSYGVIDSWWLVRVVDSFSLLNRSHAWCQETERKLKVWFTHYVNWLINSLHGKTEKAQNNNHGTWFDVQIVTFTQYIGWDQFVIQYLDTVSRRRISEQILFSGRQKFEATRTRPEHYSIYNLYGLLRLARIAREHGMDISEPDFLFSGSLHDAYSVLIDRVGQRNPASFTEKFDETDTARIWYLLLLEAILLFDEPSAYRNLDGYISRFPELHSRFMSANPEIFLHLIKQTENSYASTASSSNIPSSLLR